MNRSSFVASGLAAAAGLGVAQPAGAIDLVAAARPIARPGATMTQLALFGALPRPAIGAWTRIVLGSGAPYQKQIGVGLERAGGAALPYYETEVGSPGGSCSPNSMRKSYLMHGFGSLLGTYPLRANVGRTENFVFRFGDVEAGQHGENGDTVLHLLDDAYLYDPRPMRIVSVATERIHVASRNLLATHVVGEFPRPVGPHQRLMRIELWATPELPFGVARYHAKLAGLDPYELHCYSFGTDYKSGIDLSLAQVRAITKNDQYGQIPGGKFNS